MADGLAFDDRGRVDPNSLHQVLVNRFKASPLNGHVPPDGASWGITTGSPEEWARYGVALAKQESGFNPKSTNLSDPGGSYGLYQFNQKQFGLNGNAYDPAASTEAFVRSVEHYVPQGGIGKMGAIFGSVRRPWEGQRHLQALGGPAVSPSVASSTTSPTSMPGPRPMAQDYTGQYVPDELIRQQQGQAANYWGIKPSGGKFSLAEGLMAGLGSTVGNTQAANAIMNNQRVRSQALADGTPTLAGLLRSGVPEYQDMAAKMMLQQASPVAQEELRGAKLRNDSLAQSAPVDLALKKQTLDQSKSSFHKIGVDPLGNEQYGFVDPVNKTVTPAGGGTGDGSGVTNSSKLAAISHLSGDEWAKAAVESGALSPRIIEEIKAYKDGRLPYNPTMAQKPRGQALTALIMQYDPTFDAVNYASRNSTRKDFTSGASAKNITSFNTAIGHLGHLNDAIDGLNNTGYPIVNSAVNTIKRNVDPEFAARENKFNVARTAVTEELARAFKGMGATVTEVHEWEKKISSADSPQALRAAIGEGVALLQSRIDALGQQYNKGLGTTKDPLELLSPEARATLGKIGGHAKGDSAAPHQPPEPQHPALAAKDGDIIDGATLGHPGEKYMRQGDQLVRVKQ